MPRRSLRPLFVLLSAALLLVAPAARSAPEARILRIDPRASQTEGAPILTTVVELVQAKRLSDAVAECAAMRGDPQLDCQSAKLEQPQALYTPLAPFPEGGAVFTVTIDGTDQPASFHSKARWGESLQQPGVGTAWLILIDATGAMGPRFEDAKAIANEFVASMTPNDIVDVMFFNDTQVVSDSKWQPAAAKGQVQGFIGQLRSTFPSIGRGRPLFNTIRKGVTDGFGELGNVGQNVTIPLHQALVVLSSGNGGTDPLTNGAGAEQLKAYFNKGRFPEDNTVRPKTPLPVISVWLPAGGWEEFRRNAQEFMEGLANQELGGFYDVVRAGGGGAKAAKIVQTVRTRFNQMHIVKWRVSCVAPSVTQTFKLVFQGTSTTILGDSTFKEVPIGIDPSAWPLDIDVAYTQAQLKKDPIYPGGKFKVIGNFCWGGDDKRAEIYFLPSNMAPPASLQGTDLQGARRVQQQLIAGGFKGKVASVTAGSAEFEAPDKEKILGRMSGQTVARIIVFDNKANRSSGVTAATILTLPAGEAPFPWLWLLAGVFAAIVIALLLVNLLRSGGTKRRAGGAQGGVVAAVPVPAGGGAMAYPTPGAFAGPVAQPGHAPPAGPPGYAPPAGPPGYAAPGYGAVPADPYAAGMGQGYAGSPVPITGMRAIVAGAAGSYTVLPGGEMRAGRDPVNCQIVLQEPRVSGVHASLKMESGQLYVRDEQSNNGTWVNGVRIAPGMWTVVPSGSALRFGPVEFAVRLE